jgi:two-component system, NarL family, sensor kinase
VVAEQVALAQELATAALDETRSAIAGLRPPILDDLGLAASLESLCHSFPQLDVQVEATRSRMAEHLETAVYRTAQEALQNVAKHANARNVRIRLYLQRDTMVLEVTDDGAGFDPAAIGGANGAVTAGAMGRSEPTGFGLAAMRERTELLGGKLDLASAPRRGTTVRLTMPLSPPPAGPDGPLSLSRGGAGRPLPPGGPMAGPPGPAGQRPGRPGSRAHPRR